MPRVTLSCGEQALTILINSLNTLTALQRQTISNNKLDDIAIKTNSLISLIYGYTLTEKEGIDTDDEILNWTIADVADELCSALWNLSSGFYKTSASSLRSALEMGVVSLYFQICENEKTTSGYNQPFADWDRGGSSTPNWGTIKPKLQKSENVNGFKIKYGYCPIEKAYDYFKFLCSFTHSRAYSPEDGEGTNSMNMKSHIGFYNEEEFLRILEAMNTTISMIASTWAIIYPHIIAEWTNDNFDSKFCKLEDIFSTTHSQTVFTFTK
jgi:hypothetical protein